jgi:hypothetical protein
MSRRQLQGMVVKLQILLTPSYGHGVELALLAFRM